jgi:hypothetical protein
LRGSAFGLLAAVQSFGNLAASAIVGLLWTLASPRVAFGYLVGLCRLLQHLRHLVFELGQGAVGPIGGVGGHLGAVQRDHAKPDHPGGGAQLQRLHETAGQGGLVADTEAGDGHMVGSPVGGKHPEGKVLVAAAFDLP